MLNNVNNGSRQLFEEMAKNHNLKTRMVTIPDWPLMKDGQPVLDPETNEPMHAEFCLQQLTESQIEHWNAINEQRRQAGAAGVAQFGTSSAYLAAMAMVDPTTKQPLFKPAEIPNATKRLTRPVVETLWPVAAELAGLLKKTVEDLEKNSESSLESDSGMNSPSVEAAA